MPGPNDFASTPSLGRRSVLNPQHGSAPRHRVCAGLMPLRTAVVLAFRRARRMLFFARAILLRNAHGRRLLTARSIRRHRRPMTRRICGARGRDLFYGRGNSAAPRLADREDVSRRRVELRDRRSLPTTGAFVDLMAPGRTPRSTVILPRLDASRPGNRSHRPLTGTSSRVRSSRAAALVQSRRLPSSHRRSTRSPCSCVDGHRDDVSAEIRDSPATAAARLTCSALWDPAAFVDGRRLRRRDRWCPRRIRRRARPRSSSTGVERPSRAHEGRHSPSRWCSFRRPRSARPRSATRRRAWARYLRRARLMRGGRCDATALRSPSVRSRWTRAGVLTGVSALGDPMDTEPRGGVWGAGRHALGVAWNGARVTGFPSAARSPTEREGGPRDLDGCRSRDRGVPSIAANAIARRHGVVPPDPIGSAPTSPASAGRARGHRPSWCVRNRLLSFWADGSPRSRHDPPGLRRPTSRSDLAEDGSGIVSRAPRRRRSPCSLGVSGGRGGRSRSPPSHRSPVIGRCDVGVPERAESW